MNSFQKHLAFFPIFVALIAAGVLAFSVAGRAQAQSETPVWSEPVNLSQSGSADNPVFVANSNGVLHALWRDTYDGFVFSSNTTGEWSVPQPGSFPFDDNLPTLLADVAGNIHAFWINERGELLHNKIASENFGVVNAWTGSTILSDSAAKLAVTVDELGEIHLIYLRVEGSDTQPAGVYYTQSETSGSSWSLATPLYQSPYLRSIAREDANLEIQSAIQTDGSVAVYAVWDNLPLRRVFLIQSDNGGQTWGEALEIDGPRNTSGLSAPFDLGVAAQGEDVVLVWLVGQQGVNCGHYSKFSNDGGATWSESQRLFSQLTAGGCPQETEMIGYTDSYATLMTNSQGQIFLAAWDGSSWSEPQLQSPLGTFIDPNTMTSVDLHCQSAAISADQLLAVGCDRGAGKDIWFLERPVGDLSAWFPPPSAWKLPAEVTNSEHEFQSLQVTANGMGEVHALWMQPDGIYYSVWADRQWLQPTNIIKATLHPSDQLVATIDHNGLLYIAWTASETGETLFSWANSSRASNAQEWAERRALATPLGSTKGLDMIVDAEGTIFVIYSVPINEGRGVFWLSSTDRGQTWSEPNLIFDADLDGWEVVDLSQLSLVGQDYLVATWARATLNRGALGLYFSGFESHSEVPKAVPVVSKPVIWHDLIGFGDDTVHRIWQEVDQDQPQIWHTFSSDRGETWEQPFYISSIGEVPGPSDLVIDRGGQLHLTHSYVRDQSFLGIKHWMWDGKDWVSDEGIALGESNQREITAVASAISSNNEIFTLFSLLDADGNFSLMVTSRSLELPGDLVVAVPESQPEVELPEVESPTSTPNPTPEPTAEANDLPTPTPLVLISDQPRETSNTFTGLILGIALAIGLVAVALIIRYVMIIRRKS